MTSKLGNACRDKVYVTRNACIWMTLRCEGKLEDAENMDSRKDSCLFKHLVQLDASPGDKSPSTLQQSPFHRWDSPNQTLWRGHVSILSTSASMGKSIICTQLKPQTLIPAYTHNLNRYTHIRCYWRCQVRLTVWPDWRRLLISE